MASKNLKFSVISDFYIVLVVEGLQRLSGLFMLELLKSLDVRRQSAALPFTLSWAVANIISSLYDMLPWKKNSKYVKLFGMMLAATGAALCLFATNVLTLVIFWGLMFGVGYGLSFPNFFGNLKNTDSCIVDSFMQATSSTGTLIMLLILQMIISYYGLQGSYLIFSGIILNYLPLFLAAVYNLELSIPSIKWRERKTSRQYFVSKQNNNEIILNESFINSLEPNLALKVSDGKEYKNEAKDNFEQFYVDVKGVTDIDIKQSETRNNAEHNLHMDMTLVPIRKISSEMVAEIQNCEEERKLFEGHFSNEVKYRNLGNNESKQLNFLKDAQNYDINHTEDNLEHNGKIITEVTVVNLNKTEVLNDTQSNSLRKYFPKKIYTGICAEFATDAELEETSLNKECSGKNTVKYNNDVICKIKDKNKLKEFPLQNTKLESVQIFINDVADISISNRDIHKTNEITTSSLNTICERNTEDLVVEPSVQNEKSEKKCIQETNNLEVEKIIMDETFQNFNGHCKFVREGSRGIHPDIHTRKVATSYLNDDNANSNDIQEEFPMQLPHLPETTAHISIPLNIKAHVVEYIIEGDEDDWFKNLKSEYLRPQNNIHRNHSNSLIQGTYDNINFTTLNCPNIIEKHAKCMKSKLESTYSENSNLDNNLHPLNRMKQEQSKMNFALSKVKIFLKFVNEISIPVCLSIILIAIIFEFNYVTLIIIFADFGNDMDNKSLNLKWILSAFGLGGLFGKYCCCKISRTISEKSHAIGVVLFLLMGLSIAGTLFSQNLNWLSGFYCILGSLEGGITYIIPKFIAEYIKEDMHFKLLVLKKLLSGITILSISYAIGLSRDQLGDYEFLLQTLSCSSVLCAFLVYFLPHLYKVSSMRNSSILSKHQN